MTSQRFWRFTDMDLLRGQPDWDDDVELMGIRCPIDSGHNRGRLRVTELHVILSSRRFTDFMWVWECMIQDRVLNLFREQGFTGFEAKPVRARMKRRYRKRPDPWNPNAPVEWEDIEIPTLWELDITGWGGMAPPESGVELIEYCPGCGYRKYKGVTDPSHLIDESQWDGSDFFRVWPLPSYIFITDRVAQFIKKMKFTGVKCESLYDIPYAEAVGPGRLSEWMPDDRARKYGEPLGIY